MRRADYIRKEGEQCKHDYWRYARVRSTAHGCRPRARAHVWPIPKRWGDIPALRRMRPREQYRCEVGASNIGISRCAPKPRSTAARARAAGSRSRRRRAGCDLSLGRAHRDPV